MIPVNARLAAIMIVCALGGCSNDYRLRAVAEDGQIFFIRDEPWIGKPECIDSIEVRADDGKPATLPEPGDDDVLVLSRGVD